MKDVVDRSRRRAKWILFTGFGIFVPVPFFMVVVGGLVPFLWILVFTIEAPSSASRR